MSFDHTDLKIVRVKIDRTFLASHDGVGPKKKKIAYVLTPITFGGAERVSLTFLREVNRERFDIRPILLTRPWEKPSYFANELTRLGYAYITVPVARRPFRDPLRVPRVAWRLYSLLKKGDFELVHTHGYFADICALPAANLLGIRSVSTCHGFISNDHKLKLYNRLDICSLHLSNRVVAVSDKIKSDLVRRGIGESKVVVVPNAVMPFCNEDERLVRRREKRHFLSIEDHEWAVGYLGRLSEEKGLPHLVEAVTFLHDSAIRVKLVIVGDGPARIMLEHLVREKRIDDSVVFAGFQKDTENWLSALDIFILPSLTEGTPMALLEAMGMSVPVIATAVGGVPEVITDGVNGLLVPPADFQCIGQKVEWLMKNQELMDRIGRAGRNTIKEKYNIDSWCRTIELLYC